MFLRILEALGLAKTQPALRPACFTLYAHVPFSITAVAMKTNYISLQRDSIERLLNVKASLVLIAKRSLSGLGRTELVLALKRYSHSALIFIMQLNHFNELVKFTFQAIAELLSRK